MYSLWPAWVERVNKENAEDLAAQEKEYKRNQVRLECVKKRNEKQRERRYRASQPSVTSSTRMRITAIAAKEGRTIRDVLEEASQLYLEQRNG